MSVFDLVWPHVGKMTEDTDLKTDLENIAGASWESDTGAFLDEARRLRDIETARKIAAETKSQVYLAVLLALIPIFITLTEHSSLEGILDFDKWYRTLAFILFTIGILYGIAAIISSFRALTVSAYHRVDVKELIDCGSGDDAMQSLTKRILESVRNDRAAVNNKVSFVIVTHKLVFRMAVVLILALSFIVFPPILESIICAGKH